MMTLNSSFDKLLQNIEPDKEAKTYAQEAHKPLRAYLEKDDAFSPFFVGSFLYGSYARYTAVGGIKDIDIVVLTSFDNTNSEHTPKKVLSKLKKALTKYYEDASNIEYQRKSIQVKVPLPDNPDVKMTLDVIPAIPVQGNENPLLVPDRQDGLWVYSHPKGHLAHTSKLNNSEHGAGMFVPLVKIMKHWWAFQAPRKKAKPKGFWIETLSGECIDFTKKTFAEHFIAVLEQISSRYWNYQWLTEPPQLNDPAMPGETLKTSMTLAEFQIFMETVAKSLTLARDAISQEDTYEGSNLWHELFGDEFPITGEVRVANKESKSLFIDELNLAHEQFLFRDFGIPYKESEYRLSINCKVEQDGWRPFFLRGHKELIKKSASLTYEVEQNKSNLPRSCRIMWKVKNTGEQARSLQKLRGEITPDRGSWKKKESTSYTGTHYVECYVINEEGICIAKDRIYISIE